MFDHFKNKGENYNVGFEEKLRSAGSALGTFRNSLQIAIKGVDLLRPQVNKSIGSITAGMQIAGQEFSTVLSTISAELGITEKELAVLIATETEEEAVIATSIANRIAQNVAEENGVRLSQMDAKAKQELIATIRREIMTRSQSAAGIGGATSTMGKAKGVLSSVVGYMGGPMMVGMMAVTEGMRLIQEAQSKWQERMNDATNRFSEASDKLATAEENIGNLLRNENSSVSDAQVEQFVDAQESAIVNAYEKYHALGAAICNGVWNHYAVHVFHVPAVQSVL